MNKLDFLRRLDRELAVLEEEERREILRFYEERFYTGTIYENKTEEEVISELERPEAIARNVLEEYGVSKKYVPKKEDRYSNINVMQVLLVLGFDLIIASWLIPTLFSVTAAIIGSSFSYVGVITILLDGVTTVDEFVFAFLTGGYILYFLFGLVVLGASIYVTKSVIIWHLNVFKLKSRDKWIKRLRHISLDGWFKRHRGLNRLKNLLLVGSLVVVGYTGFWIFNHYDWVEAEYGGAQRQVETLTEDFTAEISSNEEWNIITEFDTMDVEIVLTDSTDVTVYHTYYEDDNFTFDVDYDTNEITLTQEVDFQTFFNVTDIFQLLGNHYKVRIEVPNDLILDNADIDTSTGEIDIRNVNFTSINASTSTGSITLSYIELVDDITATSSTGSIIVKNVTVSNGGNLRLITDTGSIKVESVNFEDYYIETSTGSIRLYKVNEDLYDGETMELYCDTGSITLNDVYVDSITADTSTGSIDYDNDDDTFEPTHWSGTTDTGSVDTYFD